MVTFHPEITYAEALRRGAVQEQILLELDRGDAPPGHIPVKHEPGSEVVMFSPADELHKTEAVMMKNFQSLQPA